MTLKVSNHLTMKSCPKQVKKNRLKPHFKTLIFTATSKQALKSIIEDNTRLMTLEDFQAYRIFMELERAWTCKSKYCHGSHLMFQILNLGFPNKILASTMKTLSYLIKRNQDSYSQ